MINGIDNAAIYYNSKMILAIWIKIPVKWGWKAKRGDQITIKNRLQRQKLKLEVIILRLQCNKKKWYDILSPTSHIYSNQIEWSIWENAIQYNTIQYDTIRYNTIQYNTIQYNTIQYNTIQYNLIFYLAPWMW